MGWFGSLDLAFKYALVFGSALFATLVLGIIKLLSDRSKMKKLVKDLEVQQARKGSVDHGQAEVSMREKDEGDLFGIRAIEAGFYGGVAQSAPSSLVNSPAGSRSASPAPGLRTPLGHSASSSVTITTSRPHTPSNLSPSKKFSGSSSVLNLNQPNHDLYGPEIVPHGPGSLRSTSHNSGFEGRLPMGNPSLGHTYSPKLRPSQAELNGRRNHTPIDLSPYQSSPDPSGYPQSPQSHQNRESHDSTVSQSQSESSDGSGISMPSALRMSTHTGRGPHETGPPFDNPYSGTQSVRASLWLSQSTEPSKEGSQLPTFPKNVVINSSNPQFQGPVKEREPNTARFSYNLGGSASAEELNRISVGDRWGYFTAREVELTQGSVTASHEMPVSPTLADANIADRRSRRSSLPLAITNPDVRMSLMNAGDHVQNQNQGTYKPKGTPATHDV